MLPGGITWSVMITFVTPLLPIITIETVFRDCSSSTKHQASSQAPVLCGRQAKVGLTIYLCWPHSLSINLIRPAAAGADLSHIWLWSGSGPAPNQLGPDIKKLISSPAQATQATAQTRDLGARFRLTEPICFTYDQHYGGIQLPQYVTCLLASRT